MNRDSCVCQIRSLGVSANSTDGNVHLLTCVNIFVSGFPQTSHRLQLVLRNLRSTDKHGAHEGRI
jgi:hypothetical protein